ncbi:MAG TPA: ABC transporter permease [Tangfeifania sp.]|nr:ABC transporter permease [Tangfeifania sp.]
MRLKTILRNFYRHKLNSSIIIVSLAIGIACMNLITIFVTREFNAESFQQNKSRIYALQADDPYREGQKMYFIREGAAEYMKDNFAEIEDFCRIRNVSPRKVTAGNQDYFDGKRAIGTSPNFFTFFSYELIYGNPQKVLGTELDVVISDELAQKYFGKTDVIGERLSFHHRDGKDEMIVSGVFKKPDESTQLNFEMVRSIGNEDARAYLLLAENANIQEMEQKFAQNRETIPIVHDGTPGTHYLKSLKATYFDTNRRQTIENFRNKSDLYIALVIGLMILGVAVFNYLGLINNRLIEKTGEHSIRRVNGGSKTNLVSEFLTETLLLVAVAFVLSNILLIWITPFFNKLASANITTDWLFSVENILLLTGIPALILLATAIFSFLRIDNSIRAETLKPGRFHPKTKMQVPALNISQLAVSVALIIGSIIIVKQINYITNKDIGISRDVIEVKIPGKHKNQAALFKSELEKQSSVEMVSMANASPVLEHFMLLLHYNENGEEKEYTPAVFVGDENFSRVLGVEIIEGDNFSEHAESNQDKCIINQSLARLFPDQDLIGKILPGTENTVVIGISEDFHYSSLKKNVGPGYITYGTNGFYLMVKPVSNQTAQVRADISGIWDKLITDYPVNMESVGDRYKWMHRENTNYAKLIGACCAISVFLSMIGLFAVSFHASRRRIKEIGIRKVNGAKISEILALLNTNFVKWVIVAYVIGTPIAWFVMHKWLENFAYKTNLSWWIFALAGLLTLGIALLTVSWQSWRAATRNPVDALRYE